jgi:hypothetical protein
MIAAKVLREKLRLLSDRAGHACYPADETGGDDGCETPVEGHPPVLALVAALGFPEREHSAHWRTAKLKDAVGA